MSDDEYHMVEFNSVGGKTQRVRGARKTEAELQAEAAEQEEAVVPSTLQVRIVDGCGTPGGKAILLCDQHGTALPGQICAKLDQTEERTEISVTFLVDGEEVIFA